MSKWYLVSVDSSKNVSDSKSFWQDKLQLKDICDNIYKFSDDGIQHGQLITQTFWENVGSNSGNILDSKKGYWILANKLEAILSSSATYKNVANQLFAMAPEFSMGLRGNSVDQLIVQVSISWDNDTGTLTYHVNNDGTDLIVIYQNYMELYGIHAPDIRPEIVGHANTNGFITVKFTATGHSPFQGRVDMTRYSQGFNIYPEEEPEKAYIIVGSRDGRMYAESTSADGFSPSGG